MEAAASIIAFTQAAKAVTQCIIATRELWKQIKDLPEEIQSVTAELQIWAPLFADLESQLNDNDIPLSFWDDKTARTGLEFAKSARSNFESFVNDLSDHVNSKKGIKRKVAAARICLRREAWERFEKKLSRSLTLLQHSIQFYQLALTRYSPHVIARRVTNDLTKEIHGLLNPKAQTPNVPQEASLTQRHSKDYNAVVRSKKPLPARAAYLPSYMGRFKMVSAKDTGAWQACVELPSWLSKSVFELTSRPRLSGWSWSYRVYNVVPRHSEIITRVQEGDLQGVLELVSAGKASLLDKDEKGNSLLYYATQWNQYDICRMLIHNGLGDLLDDQVGDLKQSPLSVLTYERGDWRTPTTDLAQITELYQSILEANGSVSVERLFDFIQEWAIADDFVVAFQEKFMPKWYHTSSLHDRLEAIRLGSFHVTSSGTLRKLITKDSEIPALDVTLATHEKLSLLHSVGIALGIRYADEMLPYKRGQFQWRVYTEDWGMLVSQVAAVAQSRDLHTIETITPWDVYQVPIWTGTPLISVLGGALCYISPETTFVHWDSVLQGTLQQWLECLKFAGIDLEEYGRQEQLILREQLKGALDADAIESSRSKIRSRMAYAAKDAKTVSRLDLHRACWTENHWVPVRFINLYTGASLSDWKILWAPEFEVMACQFWIMIEKEVVVMPGTWVED